MKPFVSASRPDASWSSLALPATTTAALRRIATELRRTRQEPDAKPDRPASQGFAVLFSGPSGTGKTLAAEVLANDLSRELYRVDVAGAVSKYIGETEKNLTAVFEAAEGAGAVLFFDEADALLGKRSAVTEAHDRFASTLTNYLLERIDKHDGLLILSINAVGILDHPAFMRRFARIVDFPGSETRT